MDTNPSKSSAIRVLLALFLLVQLAVAAGPVTAQTKATEWAVLEPAGEEFSAILPSNVLSESMRISDTLTGKSYSSAQGNALFLVMGLPFTTKASAPRSILNAFASGVIRGTQQSQSFPAPTLGTPTEMTLDKRPGLRYTYDQKLGDGSMTGLLCAYYGQSHLYAVLAVSRTPNDPMIPYVVDNFRLVRVAGRKVPVGAPSLTPPSSDAAASVSAWRVFREDTERFSVELPGMPTFEEKTVSSDAGPLNQKWYSRTTGEAYYGLVITMLPSELLARKDTEQLLNDTCDGMVTGAGATETAPRRVLRKGTAVGRSIQGKTADGAVEVRAQVFVVGSRSFMLVTTFAGNSEADASRFLNSFELLP